MERHIGSYGCTFSGCLSTFSVKQECILHGQSQHFGLERRWQCDEKILPRGPCELLFFHQQHFRDHLEKEHGITDNEACKKKEKTCRQDFTTGFWCGFCLKRINLEAKKSQDVNERFDHIENHFLGLHEFKQQRIEDWIHIDNYKPKRVMQFNHLPDLVTGKRRLDLASLDWSLAKPLSECSEGSCLLGGRTGPN